MRNIGFHNKHTSHFDRRSLDWNLSEQRCEVGLKRGDPIPGSRYVRDFCWAGLEPIRVSAANLIYPNYCEDCDPRPR